jgi:hypothetical protein
MGDVNRQRTKRRRELTAARRICRAVRAVLRCFHDIAPKLRVMSSQPRHNLCESFHCLELTLLR